jgi:O-antigen ligase
MLISLTWVDYMSIGITDVIHYAEIFGIFWLSYYFLSVYDYKKNSVLLAYVAGTFILCMFIFIIKFLIGPGAHPLAGYNGRFQLKVINANTVSYILSFAVFSLIILSQRFYRKEKLIIIHTGILLLFLSILMTGTRSAVVGLIFAFILGSYQFDRSTIYKLSVLVILTIPSAMFIAPDALFRVIELFKVVFSDGVSIFVGSSSIESLNARLSIWKAGASLIKSSPILGVGAGQFEPLVDPVLTRATASHNAIIGTWAESGIIGLTLLTILFKSTFSGIYNNLPAKEQLIVLPFIGFVFVMLNVTNILASVHLWFILGVLLSHSTKVKNN